MKKLMFTAIFIMAVNQVFSQHSVLDEEIAKHRKGEITVKVKSGSKVKIEQVSHEFWFGCAISDGIFNGHASENDQKIYKEKLTTRWWMPC